MTREEAIKELRLCALYSPMKVREAIKMAISALSAEPRPSAEQVTSKLKNPCDSLLTEDKDDSKEQKSKLDGDLISRADAMNAFERGEEYHADTIADILSEVPSVSAERGVVPEEKYYALLKAFGERPMIIRCKNCKYGHKVTPIENGADILCDYSDWEYFDNDFCSRAKMKGGAE